MTLSDTGLNNSYAIDIDSSDNLYIGGKLNVTSTTDIDLGNNVIIGDPPFSVTDAYSFVIKYDPLTPTITSTLYKNAAWGGYNYMYLEGLKEPLILSTIETDYISNLQTYTNVSFYSETTNNNIQFLLNQLSVRYPDPVFNKWIRAK